MKILKFSLPALTFTLICQCAGIGASSTEPLLSASGFRVVTPEGERQKEIYAALPPYKLKRGAHNSRIFYAYKDEKQGVAYVGGEEEYQRNQQLAIQRRIAQDRSMAAEMNRMTASRWYSAYPYPY